MFKFHRLFPWVSFMIIASILLASCGTPQETVIPTEAEQPEEQVTEAPTEPPAPTEKKVITLIWTQEFDSLSPLYTNMWFVTVLYPIYSCAAWFFDDQNTAFPNMVTEIPSTENGGISNDGRTITLKLRDDIVWSDGEPITSADFKL